MTTIENIRTFNTRNFTITVDAEEDYDLDLSWDNDGSVRDGLNSGAFLSFAVVVTVTMNGAEVGSDTLGGCIYSSPRAFMNHFGIRAKARKDGCNYGNYFSDMVRSAIAEARKTVSTLQSIHLRAA